MLADLMRKKHKEHIKEETKKLGKYKPSLESFEAFIEYTFANPGKSLTYKEFKKFKKGKERK